MAIAVVGDRNTIEPRLKELGYQVVVGMEGNPAAE